MKKTRATRVGALLVGLALVGAACGGDDGETTSTEAPAGSEAPSTEAPAAGDGELEGMKGTTPLVELSDDWKTSVNEFWTGKGNPELSDWNYAAESYDAVMLIALAATKAQTDGSALANEIVAISKDGEKCTDWASCIALLEAGTDIDYDGISGPNTMNGNGEPLEASYGILQFGADNRLDDAATTYKLASAPESAVKDLATAEVERAGDGVLKIGSLLPETGSLAYLGPPEFAGVEYAIEEINAAGGVLGKPVEYVQGDSGDTTTDIASITSDRLISENVDAIIGAASSSVTLTVIDKITAAGVVMFSPANTSLKLVDYPDKGLYFRNAPPDDLQGAVLADVVAGDGNSAVYILALDDAYGTSLADVVESVLTASGVTVAGKKIYDPAATSFDAEIAEIVAADPDAIVLISFDEGSRILRGLVEAGIGPKVKKIYGVDGNMGNALGENFDAGK
jgi:ABC-type branched-subunit amino acid transport system substrate-binding protein